MVGTHSPRRGSWYVRWIVQLLSTRPGARLAHGSDPLAGDEAARLLGMKRTTFINKMNRHGLK
jgi:hypothetical protein